MRRSGGTLSGNRWSRLLRALLPAILGIATLIPSRAALLDSPKRVVEGRMVDLTPLFRWWTNRTGVRPLAAWVRVTGTVAGTNSLGWVISGSAETRPKDDDQLASHFTKPSDSTGSKASSAHAAVREFLLKNPPLEEAAEFEKLEAELKQAKSERAKLQSDESEAKAQRAQVQKGTRGRVRARATGQLRAVEKADAEMTKKLDLTIAELERKLRSYPSQDRYEVNAIALDTGTEYGHLRVFDRGMPLK